MTYQVLARKWRPRDFASLVGQEHVVRALTHALDQQRLHHAYLFTGTRGVGKTTLSRILAKALNCETGITSNPCGVCKACREIDEGRFIDYVEMDAASNRGVDEMAALLERAIYAPVDARFKVYMIDEVHMLTNHAFNAMLKTLEEPPAHVKFILATTDPQKIPVTVLSRCLQFNLKQMPATHIVSHLEHVLTDEQIGFEVQALRLLARAADGSMRDALSLTDQAIAYAAGVVSESAIRGMLGALDQSYLIRLLDAVAESDGAAVLAIADEMALRSLSFSVALQDLSSLLHRIAWAQFAPASVLDEWPEADDIRRFAAALTPRDVQLYYQIATIGRSELGVAPDEFAGFTMTLLRMLAFQPASADGSAGGGAASGGERVRAPRAALAGASAAGTLAQTPAPAATRLAPDAAARLSANLVAPAASRQSEARPAPAAAHASAAIPEAPARRAAPPDAFAPSDDAFTPPPDASHHAAMLVTAWEERVPPAPVTARAAPQPTAAPTLELAPQPVADADAAAAREPNPVTATEAPSEHADAVATSGAAQPADVTDAVAEASAAIASAGATDGASASAAELATASASNDANANANADADAPNPARAALDALRRAGLRISPERKRADAAVQQRARPAPPAAPLKTYGPRGPKAESTPTAAATAPAGESGVPPWDDMPPDDYYPASGSYDTAPFDSAQFDQGGFDEPPAARAKHTQLSELTAPAQPIPEAPPQIDLAPLGYAGDWPKLAAELPLKGLAQQLACQSELTELQGDTLKLRAPAPLTDAAQIAKLKAALAEHLGRTVSLNVEAGAVRWSAAAAAGAERARQQRAAEQAIAQDSFIQALVRDFDAKIIAGSIRPIQ